MPIRIKKDKSSSNSGGGSTRRYRNSSSSGRGGGGLIGFLLPMIFKNPKLFIPIAIVVGLVYYCSRGNEQYSGIVDNALGLSTGLEMDERVYDEAEVFEPLANNRKNPLPERISLEQYAPKRLNQGSQGSCVGWASAYAAQTILYSQVLKSDPNNTAFSPSYLYNQIALPNCQGSYLKRALEVMNGRGLVPFSKFGYNENSCSKKPTGELQQLASNFKIKGYNRLTKGGSNYMPDMLAIKQNLAQNAPVLIGMMVGGSFMTPMEGKKVWKPSQSDYSMRGYGGHAMCVIGYDDYLDGGSFQIMNSWGKKWGQNGLCWVRYKDFAHFTKEAYGIYPLKSKDELTGQETHKVSIGLRKNDGGYISLSQLSNDHFASNQKVPANTEFKLEITNNLECYTYIFGQDTDKSSYVLFPYTKKHSPYCGITGTRLFPKDHSLYTDNVGVRDDFCVVITNQPIDYTKLNTALNQNKSADLKDRLSALFGNELVQESAANAQQGLVNTSFRFGMGTAKVINVTIQK